MSALAPSDVVARLVELTERETALLEELDVAGLEALHEERAPLLHQLASSGTGDASPGLVDRLHALAASNEAVAARQRTAIRGQMSHIGSGRRAINAYAPGGGGDVARGLAWLDKAG
jgi:hypothetical protein